VARVEGRLHALATPGRLEQVLDNLLANALEVAPTGSDIELTAARSGPWVEIRIRDRGPGMSSEEIAHAFDRFWRGGADEAGFGLGLAIVQRLVHADGGEIELRPREGGGLEAILRLRASVSSSARVAARVASRGER